MRPPSFISRSLIRLAVIGGMLVVTVWLGGIGLGRLTFGSDQAASRARIDAAVTEAVGAIEARLHETIRAARVDAPTLQLAEGGDVSGQQALFTRLAGAAPPGAPAVSITAYGETTTPVAWAGRPTGVPDARITGPDATFLAPGPQGLRMVRVVALEDPPGGGRRVGTLVAEALLGSGIDADGPDGYILPTRLIDVAVRPRFEGGGAPGPDEILVRAAGGDVLATASVSADALAATRAAFNARVRSAVLLALAIVALLATAPLLDWRRVARTSRTGLVTTTGVAALLLAARALVALAIRESGLAGAPLLEPPGLGDVFFRSPLDFLASSLFAGALVVLAGSTLDLWRVARRGGGLVLDTPGRTAAFLATQGAAGAVVTAIVVAYEAFLRFGVAAVPSDILHFGLRPWDWHRLAIVSGLVVLNVTVIAAGVLVLRLARAPWAVGPASSAARAAMVAAWLVAPVAAIAFRLVDDRAPALPTLLVLIFAVAVAWRIGRVRVRLRHASQAGRLMAAVLTLVLPSIAFYPSIVDASDRARHTLVETRFAPEVLEQRLNLQRHLADALAGIDRMEGLDDVIRAAEPPPQGAPPTDAAFFVWSQTTLAAQRLTSSVELYNGNGALVSRFALKLPDASGALSAMDTRCEWDVFEEVSPFFAEERRLLHAGRSVCATLPDGRVERYGSVVVHLMLDYANLSFVSAQSPYVAMLRAGRTEAAPPVRRPVHFTAYGWSRKVLYSSASTVSPIDDETFARASAGREPFWTEMTDSGRRAEAYVLNDRGAIYMLSAWKETPFGHLVVLAELVTLAVLTFLLGVLGGMVYGTVAVRTPTSGRALLREVRASFYRKLFLAFVAAAIVPVVALAFVTRAYFASLMFADIEMEATRTASVASRVVEDFGSLQARGLAAIPLIDDNVVVWLSRVIAQDVNIFTGPTLLASSERNLFASGLLPTRTPGDVYRAILLEGRASFVGREAARGVTYLVAAAPVRVQEQNAILMVPLTSRQQDIEGQIEELDRRMLLAALLFIMLGAGIGYSMAERIADPVNRLMRATRRIARGDLDARVLATSSDELRRLVEAFNGMAEDLRRQRAELERTNKLAAWADMARQVAHDIKNPLTPIQLTAEHLQRVHADRGRPLGPLVDDCVASILGQVRLLRQISAEFSSFASAPQPRRVPTALGPLVQGIIDPYTAGLAGRVRFVVEIPTDLPLVDVDPLLIGRALTNVIENALHAMTNGGALVVAAASDATAGTVALRVTDSGIGMDAEAQARIFEPYFSTKTTGTGLGLTIAKRNVEANGGTIGIESSPGLGTSVSMVLPVSAARP